MGGGLELYLSIQFSVSFCGPLYLSPPAPSTGPPFRVRTMLPHSSHKFLRCLCSSSALSTSSCGPGTVGSCSRRPRGTGRARTRAKAPAPRAQLSREPWRSSKQPPPGYSRTGCTSSTTSAPRTSLFLLLQLPSPATLGSGLWALRSHLWMGRQQLSGTWAALPVASCPSSARAPHGRNFLSTAWTQAPHLGRRDPHSLCYR